MSMWDDDKQKRSGNNKRRAPRIQISMQRVHAEIQVEATKQVVDARVFLNDLSTTGVGLFAHDNLVPGENISVVIEQPRHLYVKGVVVWCSPYTMTTKIITAETFNYRAGIRFIFDTEEERKTIADYVESLHPTPAAPTTPKK